MNLAVTTAKINDLAVTTGKLNDLAVTEGKVAAGAVTADKLGAGAVTVDKLGSGAVTEAKIGTGAVTADKLGANAVTAAKLAATLAPGREEIFIPAGAFIPQITTGAAYGLTELATTLQPLETLEFDTTTQEFAVFGWAPPKRWDLGTITAVFYWTAASGSGGVAFALQGVAVSDDDALNAAYGTEQVATDELITASDLHISAVTSAITLAGTPADADVVWLRVKRVPSNGSDTLGVDARLIGVKLFYTADQGNDA